MNEAKNLDAISSFRNEYFFLSNFYNCEINYRGISYQNTEAAFQAQKTMDQNERRKFSTLNPSEAKRLGRHVKLRSDWEEVKEEEMYFIVLAKFMHYQSIRNKLMATWPAKLIEGNDWGDTCWGVCRGKGENRLGQILMDIRERLLDLYSRDNFYEIRYLL